MENMNPPKQASIAHEELEPDNPIGDEDLLTPRSPGSCELESCLKGGKYRCSNCKAVSVNYCCQAHQKEDWRRHRNVCGKSAIEINANFEMRLTKATNLNEQAKYDEEMTLLNSCYNDFRGMYSMGSFNFDRLWQCMYEMMGIMYMGQSHHSKALKLFQKVLSLRLSDQFCKPSDTAGTYSNIGMAYEALKEFDLSIYNYKKALELDPNEGIDTDSRAGTYFNIAGLLISQGGTQEYYDLADEYLKNTLHTYLRIYGEDGLELAGV